MESTEPQMNKPTQERTSTDSTTAESPAGALQQFTESIGDNNAQTSTAESAGVQETPTPQTPAEITIQALSFASGGEPQPIYDLANEAIKQGNQELALELMRIGVETQRHADLMKQLEQVGDLKDITIASTKDLKQQLKIQNDKAAERYQTIWGGNGIMPNFYDQINLIKNKLLNQV